MVTSSDKYSCDLTLVTILVPLQVTEWKGTKLSGAFLLRNHTLQNRNRQSYPYTRLNSIIHLAVLILAGQCQCTSECRFSKSSDMPQREVEATILFLRLICGDWNYCMLLLQTCSKRKRTMKRAKSTYSATYMK